MDDPSSVLPPPLNTGAAESVVFPPSAAERDLEELKKRDREQQITRSLWTQRVSGLWGTEPPYEEQAEDRSGWIFGALFYTWIGYYVYEASREQLTERRLPKPTRQYRAYNAGVALSAELQRQRARRHAWDGYVGARVGVLWDDASDGVLRWVGAVQQYGTPRQLYAGVEWRVAPSRRRGGWAGRCMRRLLCRRGHSPVPEHGPGAYHRGEVDGEHLFDPVEDDTVLTCERVEDVVFRLGLSAEASQGASTRALMKELPESAQRCPLAIQVWWSVWTLFSQSILHIVVLGVLRNGCQLMTPILLKWLVTYLSDVSEHRHSSEADSTASSASSFDLSSAMTHSFKSEGAPDVSWQRGVWLVALMFVTMICATLAGNKQYHVRRRCSLQVRNALSASLFEKVFTMSSKATHHPAFNAGRLTNLMSTDVEVVGRFTMMFWTLVSTPFMLVIVFYQLYVLLGASVCAGGVVAFVLMPLQTWSVKRMSSDYRRKAQATDHRVKATTEFFSGIRVAKFMSWEPFFISRIEKLRRVELSHLKRLQKDVMIVFFQLNSTPGFVIASVFFAFSVTHHTLTPTIVFPAIALFNLLMGCVSMLPFALQLMTKLLVSLQRLNMFFEAEDELVPAIEDIADLTSCAKPTDFSCEAYTREATQKTVSSALVNDVAADFAHADLSTYVAQELKKMQGAKETNSAMSDAAEGSALSEAEVSLSDSHHSSPSTAPARVDAATAPSKAEISHARHEDAVSSPDSLPPSTQKDNAEITFNEDSIYVLKRKTLLADVDLRVPRGRLTVVLGPTGSGKSTLLDALIGALAVTRGRVACSRSVAYVPQQPWIMSATLRDNVVFFGAPDAVAFERAVRSSQLATDLALLADGAETEIGERGINLSGGQRARVSLARAVYADRDVYVLDDPLSALDAQVGERVMRECVCGALAGKTRVLATHQVSAAAYADLVVLLEEGRVAFQGSYAAYCDYAQPQRHAEGAVEAVGGDAGGAVEAESPPARSTVKKLSTLICEAPPAADSTPTAVSEAERRATEGTGKLLTEEERFKGAVEWAVYVRYMKACGGVGVCMSVMAVYLVTEVVMVSPSLWLALWSTKWLPLSATQYSLIYSGLSLASALTTPLRYWLSMTVMRRASREVHRGLLHSVSCATLQFFDTTPLGRIVNRFTNDIGNIDSDLQSSYSYLLSTISRFFSTVATMVATQVFVLGILIPCIVAYYYLLRFYARANREIKRLVNRVSSPMLSVLQEVIGGRWTVQAYGAAPAVIQKAIRCADVVFTCSYLQLGAELWLSVRIQLLSTTIIVAVALGAVAAVHVSFLPSHIGLLSLSLTLALEISSLLDGIVTVLASVEADMNSIERVFYMTDHIDHEDLQGAIEAEVQRIRKAEDGTSQGSPETSSENNESVGFDSCSSPLLIRQRGNNQFGSIVFEHVDMRYRPGLPLVLRDVCFAVAPGQKVGVVGRTGSGKSTLLLAFLRLVEVCGGRMLVCGRDARDYDVRGLRQLFSMIPQDPLLFDGTVRSNVDPFGRCGDAAVWRALRQVGMEERVRGEAGGLDGRVQEGGANYSVGQRQLLCLARALLKRGSAFLLMDEATANVDPALDRQIQRTVQHTFRDYTVVTIAHRLHTVAACDAILVMDQGRVLEFGSPRELVEREGSAFSALVMSLGNDGKQLFMKLMTASLTE
ncbi:p-glycoprotein e [Leishmania braziliensis MHOM/BR/75/M2904]|uniref:p-glycoprotein e n=1 Tax=Leishmania braziliensis TaxID=5660 RepID=A4HJB0_LEIBR|nr:p-glycoprotein e [Leishmania braziliensis MHOM/BR/75/M2904]CAM42570.1 p-glycoprotein e [Leishmania braziliensis MHOM/BR/75/M2904]